MRIDELLSNAVKLVKNKSLSLKDVQILLAKAINKDINFLIINNKQDIDTKEQKIFFEFLQEALNNKPIEYITNSVCFYSEDFFIQKGALIPRPESEILVDKVLEIINNNKYQNIAEIGTGSGALSIIIAKKTNCKIIATDISKDAIKVAKQNIKLHNIEDKIKLIHTSYLDGVDDNIDIIFSNPPYIQNDYKIDENLHYEPKEALFGGKIGDEILKDIILLSKEKNVKFLACEMGYDQKDNIYNFVKDNIQYKQILFYKDLASFDRGFVLQL